MPKSSPLKTKIVDEEDSKIFDELVKQTAWLDALRIVRQNLWSVQQYWKYRRTNLQMGGIKLESNVNFIDMGDVFELRITVRVPPDAGEHFLRRKELFKIVSSKLEKYGKDYLLELFRYKGKYGSFPLDTLEDIERELKVLEALKEGEKGDAETGDNGST